MNKFGAGYEMTCLAITTNEANMFGAGDKITRLPLKTNPFSIKDGMHLAPQTNSFNVIKTNALATGGERVWR